MAAREPDGTLGAVRVDVTPNLRGGWDLRFSDRRPRESCDTLPAAIRLAHDHAEESQPCELVIRDAYHRVVRHEFIDGEAAPQPAVNA